MSLNFKPIGEIPDLKSNYTLSEVVGNLIKIYVIEHKLKGNMCTRSFKKSVQAEGECKVSLWLQEYLQFQ